MYRQGDVLIVAVDGIPENAEQLERDNGLVVLAYGEATGHHHAVADPEAVLYDSDGDYYLRVAAGDGVALAHQEHSAIVLPPGDYRVARQREYTPEKPRPVQD